MKKRYWLPFVTLPLILFLLAACGTAPPASPTATPGSDPNGALESPLSGPTSTPPLPPTAESFPAGYPGSQPAAPVQPTHDANYPPPPTFPPTVDPYPGGLVWVIRPVGIQCEDGPVEGYGDLNESVATLAAAGLQVENYELVDIPVQAVCGGPTSAHYRVQISPSDLDTARAMGWEREP